jgi:hypothetical protein
MPMIKFEVTYQFFSEKGLLITERHEERESWTTEEVYIVSELAREDEQSKTYTTIGKE